MKVKPELTSKTPLYIRPFLIKEVKVIIVGRERERNVYLEPLEKVSESTFTHYVNT